MKIAFLGTGQFAANVLASLLASAEFCPICIGTQPPRRAGHGLKLQPSPVEKMAQTMGHTVTYSLNDISDISQPNQPNQRGNKGLDVIVVCDYGVLLPPPILECAKWGAVNIHPSLLPRWRGAAPIERAILAGDAQTGVCLMQMVPELDAGDILMQSPPVPITPAHNRATLLQTLSDSGSSCLLQYIRDIRNLSQPPHYQAMPQATQGVTYARKLTAQDRQINFNQPAFMVARQIQAFAPKPGAFFVLDGQRIKILQAEAVDLTDTQVAGTLLVAEKNNLQIACQTGAIKIHQIQREGKQPLPPAPFLNGFPLCDRIGTVITAAPIFSANRPTP